MMRDLVTEVSYMDRFEIIGTQSFDGYAPHWQNVYILRDKQTGVLYLSFADGLTALLDRTGKPMTDLETSV